MNMDKIPEQCGVLIVLSGPSGAGKSSILSQVMKQRQNLCFSVSCTTRSPRPGEEHGKAYYFLEKEDFEAKIAGEKADKSMLENAYKNGIPVEGKVEKEIKGGFEVKIGEVRGFCPYS